LTEQSKYGTLVLYLPEIRQRNYYRFSGPLKEYISRGSQQTQEHVFGEMLLFFTVKQGDGSFPAPCVGVVASTEKEAYRIARKSHNFFSYPVDRNNNAKERKSRS
jgi:hypothetical protein